MRFTLFTFLTGDPDLSGVLETNGSNESFELVTEENNGDGSKKQGTEGRCSLTDSQNHRFILFFFFEKTCGMDLNMPECVKLS